MKRKLWISVLLCLFLAASVLFLCACERPEKTGTEKPGTEEPGTEEPDEGNEDDPYYLPGMDAYVKISYYLFHFNDAYNRDYVLPGECISAPNPPTYEGLAFTHWETKDGKKWDFSTPVEKDLSLYAVWIDAVDLTITFNWDEEEIPPIQTHTGETIALPIPEKEGYRFRGYDCVSEQGKLHISSDDAPSFLVPFCSDAQLTPFFVPIWSFEPINDGTEYRASLYVYITSTIYPSEKELTLPSSYNGKPVTELADYALVNDQTLQKLIVPGSYRKLGESCFESCFLLEEVILEEGVEEIGRGAFNNCTKLTSVSLPDSLVSIGAGSFSSSAITELTIPAGVERIGNSAFVNCSALIRADRDAAAPGWDENWCGTCIVLYNGDEMLEQDSLIYVLKPNGEAYLSRATDLTRTALEIPDNVTANGKTYTVTRILREVLFWMRLETLVLPEGLEWLGPDALPRYNYLLPFYEEDGVKYLGSRTNPKLVIYWISDTRTLTVPAQTHIIYQNAGGPTRLHSLQFSDDGELTQIGANAFLLYYKDSPVNVILPEVRYIDSNAFSGNISRIFYSGEGENWAEDWHGDAYAFDLTQGQRYTDESGEWFLQDGKATLLSMTANRENGVILPYNIQTDGKNFVPFSILYAATWGEHTPFLYLPSTVTRGDFSKLEQVTSCVVLEADSRPSEAKNLSLPDNHIYCGIDSETLLADKNTLFVVSNGSASALCILEKTGATYFLPRTVQGMPIHRVLGNFLPSALFMHVAIPDTVLYFEKAKHNFHDVSIYVQAKEKPEGWEEGWDFSENASSVSVYFGAEFSREERVTFTFVTNGTAVSPQTEYFLPTCPETWLNYHYFWGWYENADYSGESISFPYFGTATTLYARFQMVPKEDGKLKETAFCVTENEPFRAEIRAGESIYFRLPSPRVNATYVAEMTVTADTYTELSDANYVIDETKSSAGETLSFRYTSYGGSHYLCIRLDGEAETATAEILFYRE